MKNSILIQTSEFFFFLQRNEGQYFTKTRKKTTIWGINTLYGNEGF